MTTIQDAIDEARKIAYHAGPMGWQMMDALKHVEAFVKHPTAHNRWELEMRVGASLRLNRLCECNPKQRKAFSAALCLGRAVLDRGVPYNEVDPRPNVPEIPASVMMLIEDLSSHTESCQSGS